jgi:hypothetical protein
MINANLKFFLSFLIIHFSFPYFSYFPFPFIFSFFLFPLASLSPVLASVARGEGCVSDSSARGSGRRWGLALRQGRRLAGSDRWAKLGSGRGRRPVGSGMAPGTDGERRAAAAMRWLRAFPPLCMKSPAVAPGWRVASAPLSRIDFIRCSWWMSVASGAIRHCTSF